MHREPAWTALLALTLVGLLAGSAVAARAQEPPQPMTSRPARRWRLGSTTTSSSSGTWPPQTTFLVGPDAVKQQATDLRAFIPDPVITDDDIVAEGDRVVIR